MSVNNSIKKSNPDDFNDAAAVLGKWLIKRYVLTVVAVGASIAILEFIGKKFIDKE